MAALAALALIALVYGLVSRSAERANLSAPMAFTAAGVLAGPAVLDAVEVDLTGGPALILAEVALVVVLFSDAARIDLRALSGNAALPGRLLGAGMPLTIGLGAFGAALLITPLELWEAAIVAAVLAPTDAALGAAVASNEQLPKRIRQTLNVESGLNDGLSVPFLTLFIALAVEEGAAGAGSWVGFAAEQIGLGTLAGLAIGGLGGVLAEQAIRRSTVTGAFQQIAFLSLAVLAWAVADGLGGNGFIAAFVAGLAAGRVTASCGQMVFDFTEDEGQVLSLSVFLLFGAAAPEFLGALTWPMAAFGLLSLTVVRMVPVAIALVGSGLRWRSVAFLGWFGPRGLASIILALVVVEEEPGLPALDAILAVMTFTVLVSIAAHGLSARPLAGAYGRWAAALPADAAEMSEVAELPMRGAPR